MRPVSTCKHQIQPLDSAYCPLYAMFMALYLDWYPWDKNTTRFPVYFSMKNPKVNDQLIGDYLRILLGKINDKMNNV